MLAYRYPRRMIRIVLLLLATMLPSLAAAQMQVPVLRAEQTAGFEEWKTGFRGKALAAGIPAQVFDEAFTHVRYKPVDQEDTQPEFIRPIWEYIDNAVSSARISTGRQKAAELAQTLALIERKYAVEANILLAFWGMETNFGSFRGSTNTISALANAAYNSRRRDFAEDELLAALKIIASGEISAANLVGGWSGAMGHMQFIPTTYLEYAVDMDGDGRRNIWSDNPADALASAANYIRSIGWKSGAPWGVEVILPQGFDYSLIGEYENRKASFWNARGVSTVTGGKLPNHGATALIAPAGAHGPIFAIFPNFQVIRQYNMSVSYSLSVGHLANRIAGGGGFSAAWPRSDTQLTRSQIRELQERLAARGFDVGVIDGMIGPKTVEAVQAYQASAGLLADGYANLSLLQMLSN